MIIQARPGDAPAKDDDDARTGLPVTANEGAGEETGALYRAVYGTCYGLGFGLTLPLFFLRQAVPFDNAFGHGLRDGARAACDSSDRTRENLGQAVDAVKTKAGDAYANIAQRVQEKVEAAQDAIAARRYRRRHA